MESGQREEALQRREEARILRLQEEQLERQLETHLKKQGACSRSGRAKPPPAAGIAAFLL
jgi:hypothetical protein